MNSKTIAEYRMIADALFPNAQQTPQDLFRQYVRRDLPQTAFVTRYGPSPTGSLHVGAIFLALINKLLAHQSGGVYIVRIEDTDQNRRIDQAERDIVRALAYTDTL